MFKLGDEDFYKLYQRERDARGKMRFLALHHLKQGKSKSEVCEMVCVSRPTLNEWVAWYQNEGIQRLRQKVKGRGVKARAAISSEQLQRMILNLQAERGGGRVIGEDIREWIFTTYGVKYHLNYIYYILNKLGLSWVSARSIHPNANQEIQESFKKTSRKTF